MMQTKAIQVEDGRVLTVRRNVRAEDQPGAGWVNYAGDVQINWVRTPEGLFTPPAGPTTEELRALMPPLTARQIRLVLKETQTPLSAVQTLIDQIEDEDDREYTQIEWDHAGSFERSRPLITTLGTALGYTPEQIDALWVWGLTL